MIMLVERTFRVATAFFECSVHWYLFIIVMPNAFIVAARFINSEAQKVGIRDKMGESANAAV